MPDDRFLHKRLGRSARVCNLSDFEFRVWVQYELSADDCGVMPMTGVQIQADNDYFSEQPSDRILAALRHFVDVGLLARFDHQRRAYVCQLDWQDFQKVRHPRESHLPMPPDEMRRRMTPATIELFDLRQRSRARDTSEPLPKDSGKVSEKFPSPARADAIAKRLTANGDRRSAKRGDPGGDVSEGFDAFWAAYPRKVAKAAALTEWARLAPSAELTALIMGGLERAKHTKKWREDMAEPEMPHIPHARTWLHQRRWEDVVATGRCAPHPDPSLSRLTPELAGLCDAAGLTSHQRTWLEGAVISRDDHHGVITLVISDHDNRSWVIKHYHEILEAAVIARGGSKLQIAGSVQ